MSKPNSKLGNWGIALTAIYFAVILIIICFTDLVNTRPLSMNELGDFLAGVFGPPALVWVVISFYLQSAELQNSVNALNLQAEELRKSVEQQKALVELTKESITHEKTKLFSQEERRRENLKPNFTIELIPSKQPMLSSSMHNTMRVKNIGGPAKNTRIEVHGEMISTGNSDFARVWDRGDQDTFQLSYDRGVDNKSRPKIIISFQDSENRYGEQTYTVDFFGNCHEIARE